MKKMVKKIPVLAVASLCLASPVLADGRVDAITRQLANQGFGEIKISRTFLGRVRVEALREGREREIIFNPRTGEILRDYWDVDSEGNGGWLLGTDARREEERDTRSRDRREEDDDDDRDDDDHDDDRDDDDDHDDDHDDDDDDHDDHDEDDDDDDHDDDDDRDDDDDDHDDDDDDRGDDDDDDDDDD